LSEFDVEVVGEDVSYFIETFQTAVVIDNGLRAAESVRKVKGLIV
jgi:hypothetical protein